MPFVANPERTPHPKDPNALSMTARFPVDTFRKIQQLAQDDQRSLNNIVNKLVDEGLASFESQGLIARPR